MTPLARLLVRIFFRELEAEGHHPANGVAARSPAEGRTPTVMVVNHRNGLVDGLVLIAASQRYPHFLGKSTLWKIPPLRPFLALAGVVPVYRSADAQPGADSGSRHAGNDAAFAQSRALLAAGDVVAIFPEGISHDEPAIAGMRSGAARIALGAAGDDAVAGVVVQPVGLVYDDKTRFRSRVLVRFGPPLPVDPLVEAYRLDPPAAIRDLTACIGVALRATAPDYADAALEADAELLAAIASRDPTTGRLVLSEQERLARALARAAGGQDGAARARLVGLASAARTYLADLSVLGCDDAVLLDPAATRRRARLGATTVASAAAVPIAVLGVAIHIVPYAVVKVLGRVPRNASMRATVKLLSSFILYLLTYLGVGVAVGRRRGWRAGLVAAIGAPSWGYVAVRTGERIDRADGVRRATGALRRGTVRLRRLRARREELVAAILVAAQLPSA